MRRGTKATHNSTGRWCPHCGWSGPDDGGCGKQCPSPVFSVADRKDYEKRRKVFERELKPIEREYQKKLKALEKKHKMER